ncbi:MAG: hypothetical protein KIT84_09430 [Labilithrix sp.]|nr:hypothetical protein [Labilithrix sp.]MCW5811222.1 hypothetical protein [Labilithrix sp.]
MKLSLVVPFMLLGSGVLAAACSSSDGDGPNAEPDGGVIGGKKGGVVVQPEGGTPGPNGKVESDIVFADGAKFAARPCGTTIRYEGPGNDVKIAGEFTSPPWAEGAQALTKTGSAFEITIAPSATAAPGQVYGYKLIVDGNWHIDPANKYRKIVGGQMNSGLVLPACEAGPELRSGKVAIDGGTMKVRVDVLGASDKEPVDRVKASFDGAPVADANVVAIDAENGAIELEYKALAKGKHTLSLRALDKKERESEPIDLPFWVEDEVFDYQDGVMYMILLDRFANGEKANDAPVASGVHYDADWHGGDLQGATKVLESGYFEKLGVRTIWLSPTNEQTSKWHYGDGGQLFSAYHGYWPVKARSVEPRFGGNDALKKFVTAAHARGIRVLLDLINNQIHEDHEYFKDHPDWFRTACQCGTPGCGWSEKPFECLFQPYLPDIDWNQPGSEKQFIADAVNWIAAYDLDGFRVDAVKHVEANSVYNMRAELARRFEQGGARVFMVGEIAVGGGDSGTFFGESFSSGYDWINAYTGPQALDGQFDFPTRHWMADGLLRGDKPLNEIEDAIRHGENTYVKGNRNVRFLNGHDNDRIASVAAMDPKLGCRWAEGCRDGDLPPLAYTDPQVYVRLKRALTVLYSIPGVPYLYQGDEVAFGGGGDPDMRRNMLFDGAGDDLVALEMARPGSQPPVLTAAQQDLRAWTQKLGAARTGSRALRRGDRKTLLSTSDLWVYAYQSGPKEIAVVAINRGAAVSARPVDLNQLDLAGVASWTSALGTGSFSTSGTLTLGPGEAAIFTAK